MLPRTEREREREEEEEEEEEDEAARGALEGRPGLRGSRRRGPRESVAVPVPGLELLKLQAYVVARRCQHRERYVRAPTVGVRIVDWCLVVCRQFSLIHEPSLCRGGHTKVRVVPSDEVQARDQYFVLLRMVAELNRAWQAWELPVGLHMST